MNKPLKIACGAAGAIVALVVLTIVGLLLFVNPNDYRDLITAQVKQNTGRSFGFASIHLSLWPTLGLKLNDAVLGNARGFGSRPFARIGAADVGVGLLPLIFHRQLVVKTIYLSKLRLDLAKNAEGVSNWADLAGAGKPQAATPVNGGAGISGVRVGGVNIDDATLDYRDAQKNQAYEIAGFNLSTGALDNGRPFGFRTNFDLRSQAPAMDAKFTASGRVSADFAARRYAIHGLEATLAARGKTLPGGTQTVKFRGDLDYDGATGSARLSAARLQAAGLDLGVDLQIRGLDGGAPHYRGTLRLKPFSPRNLLHALAMNIRPSDAGALQTASLAATLAGNAKRAELTGLTLKLDDSTATGDLTVADFSRPAISFALQIDRLNVDRYLPAKRTKHAAAVAPPAHGAAQGAADTKVSTQALTRYGLNGSLAIASLQADGLKLAAVRLKLDGPAGADKTAQLHANFYGGQVDSRTRIGAGAVPAFSESARFSGVAAGPLLKDLFGKDAVTGTAAGHIDVTTLGNTLAALKRALDGELAFQFQNGALKGLDIGRVLRQGQSLLHNPAQAIAAPVGSSEQTDFSAMSVSGKIHNGVLSSNDLSVASPLLRVGGAGTVDLVAMRIDYTLQPSLVEAATGQGGRSTAQLAQLTLPIRVTGPLASPHYAIDVQAALKQQAAATLRGKLGQEKNRLKNKLKSALKGLFGGG